MLAELPLPSREILGSDRKTDVKRTLPVMGRNCPSRHVDGFKGLSAFEKQEDASPGHVIGTEAVVARQAGKSQHALIDPGGSVDIIHVQSRLENAPQGRPRGPAHHMSSATRASSDMRL